MLRTIFIIISFILFGSSQSCAQINVNRMLMSGRNALYYEDYVLSIQRFNMVINARPNMAEPYYYRGLAKFYLGDYAGADLDVSNAIYLNPYELIYFKLRALCRVNIGHFLEAEDDYKKVLLDDPDDAGCWHNLALCQIRSEAYERADSTLDKMITRWPNEPENYIMRIKALISRNDTITAEHWIDKALEAIPTNATCLNWKAMLLLQRQDYTQCEPILDRAIAQSPHRTDFYLTRAILRYQRDDLRGAMSDYDTAIELNPNTFVGHHNRGLLRNMVGDYNRAIDDFDFVIKHEPDNYLAIYNRALLYEQTGNYRAAIRDLTTLIGMFPQFWSGYYMRAQLRRKIGDLQGAAHDEFKLMKVKMEGVPKAQHVRRLRSRHDKSLDDYSALLAPEIETVQEDTTTYADELRGRVQDRVASFQPMPNFVLSYYHRNRTFSRYIPLVDDLVAVNRQKLLLSELFVTNSEATASESLLKALFDDIEMVTQEIAEGDSSLYLRRSLDYYHVRDFESALADVEQLLQTPNYRTLALLLRSQLRYAMVMANHGELTGKADAILSPSNEVRLSLHQALDDLKAILKTSPKQIYALYNMGNIYIILHEYDKAIEAFTEALSIDPQFPDAYYNRGIAHVLSGEKEKGHLDLSKAGGYGLYSAYNLIKQSTKQME